MKLSENDPLELLEYFSIGISIIGIIIANAVGQSIYAVAPIIFTIFLNLLSRNRLKQRIEKNTRAEVNRLDNLQLEHSNITLAEVYRLEKLQQQSQKNNNIAIAEVGARIQRIPETIRRVEDISSQLNHLSDKYSLLREETNKNIKLALHEIGIKIQEIPELIIKIDSLNRRFDNLSSQVDAGSNIRVINEIQSQIVSVKSEIKNLTQQQEIEKTTNELDILTSNFNNTNESNNILQIRNDLIFLESRLNNFSFSTQAIPQEIYNKIDDLQIELNILKRRFNAQINVDISTVTHRLEPIVLLAIQKIINQPEVDKSKLIYDRGQSRKILYQALNEAEERIIIVCPWITVNGLSDVLKSDIEKALGRGVKIDIGWGMLRDMEEVQKLNSSGKVSDLLQNVGVNSKWYNAVSKLTDLQQSYPSLLNLKLVGTHEKFLVCDRSWALITSHNFLTSSDSSSDREIGLCTYDASIITPLIHRYEDAPDLDKTI